MSSVLSIQPGIFLAAFDWLVGGGESSLAGEP